MSRTRPGKRGMKQGSMISPEVGKPGSPEMFNGMHFSTDFRTFGLLDFSVVSKPDSFCIGNELLRMLNGS